MLTETKEQSLLENALLHPALEQNWEMALEGWESASPLQRSAVRGFAESIRAFILNLGRDISSDADELNRVLAIVYIHLKSQWIMFNTQVGYRLAEQDERGSEEASCRAALVYTVIEVIEGFIQPAEAERLSRILENPGAEAADAVFPPAAGGSEAQLKMQQLEERLALIDAERLMLEREVGAGDAEDIVRRFRRLQSQLADAEKKQQEIQEEAARLKQQFNDLDPTEAPRQLLTLNAEMAKLRVQLNAFSQDRDALERIIGTFKVEEIGALWHDVHQRITEQEKRLAYFEAQQSQLEREAGTAVASEITVRLRTQNDQITALEEQVGPLTVVLKALERELGHSDPAQITAMVTELRQALNRAETDMTELRYFREVLSQELGTEDAYEIATRFKELNETMISFNSLASMMDTLDSDLTELNQRPDILPK